MLFVKAIHLCTVLIFTPYARANDESRESETAEEAGSLLKFFTENASSVSLIKEIADALKKEEDDVGKEEKKKSLRWGDTVYKTTETFSTSGPPSFPTDKPKPEPLGQHNPHPHNVYNPNDLFTNIDGLYSPKEADIYNPQFIDSGHHKTKDVVQKYVDNLLTHQKVPALLLHVSLAGIQPNDKTLVAVPINVNFNHDKQEADHGNKEWIPYTQNVNNARPVLSLRSGRGASEEKDIELAKAIIDKIKRFSDLEKRNKTDSQ